MIRKALLGDVRALLRIENASFDTDRINARQFRYLIQQAHGATLVETSGEGRIRGYATVLFHRGTSLARLYSIAVDPGDRGKGVGTALLRATEEQARTRRVTHMRLEVRADDPATQALYSRLAYRPIGTVPAYYDDGMDAVRMERLLVTPNEADLAPVAYYPQSLNFTCGPAALLMAMHTLDPSIGLDQGAEIRLWRDATTVFMTSGHGGCSPRGLALAAWHHGFGVDLYLSQSEPFFVDSVRGQQKREVIRLVEQEFETDLRQTGVRIYARPLSLAGLRKAFAAGGIPLVLISTYRFDRSREPHWVVVTGFDRGYIYLHDPYVNLEQHKTETDCMHIPVSLDEFTGMASYGRARQKAALVLMRR
jgi:ribosomal protein S18 acetylase RimI-like enzyme